MQLPPGGVEVPCHELQQAGRPEGEMEQSLTFAREKKHGAWMGTRET